MKVIHSVFFVMVTIVLTSCSKSYDEQEYVAWIRDYSNGLHVSKTMGDYVFDVQYTPSDYMWIQNKETLRNSDDGMQYYVLTIATVSGADLVKGGISNESERQTKLYYLSYTFQQDISLEDGGKVLPCVMYHFEKPADLRTSRTFLLGFEKMDDHERSNDKKEVRLIIASTQFGSLPIQIKISKDNIPALAI